MSQGKPLIGVVGGAGPEAGVSLCSEIHRLCGAVSDQDFPAVALISRPRGIPDRTRFLDGMGNVNPGYPLAAIVEELTGLGATAIGIPCNTAHAPVILDVVLERLRGAPVRFVHMIEETARESLRRRPGTKRIGVLATNGTVRSRIYSDVFARFGIETIYPAEAIQHSCVHRAIYDPQFGIKASPVEIHGRVVDLLDAALEDLARQSCDCVALGCTELPLALPGERRGGVDLISSTAALARGLLRESGAAP